MSQSINESIKREVYVCEYKAPKSSIVVNNKTSFTINAVWLEKRWAYGSNLSNTIIINGYQLIVHTADKLDEDYSFTWTIGTNFKRNFRSCGEKCMITEFSSLPNEVETWDIQEGRSFNDSASTLIIGKFILIKK